MIEADIYKALTRARFGSSPNLFPARKIYPIYAPQESVPPYITYNIASKDIHLTLGGPTVLRNTICTVDLFARSYLEVKELSESAIDAMVASPDFKIGSINISEDDWELETDFYMLSIQFSLWQRQ